LFLEKRSQEGVVQLFLRQNSREFALDDLNQRLLPCGHILVDPDGDHRVIRKAAWAAAEQSPPAHLTREGSLPRASWPKDFDHCSLIRKQFGDLPSGRLLDFSARLGIGKPNRQRNIRSGLDLSLLE
jgi:hypothetical protein